MHVRAALTLLLLAGSLPSHCDAKKKKKRSKTGSGLAAKAKPAPVKVDLTELEICEGCYTYVEQHWKLMHTLKYQLGHEAKNKGKNHLDINGDEWAKKLCRTNLYDSFTDEAGFVCRHMKDSYWDEVIVPMREALSMSAVDVMYKKRELCKEHVCGNVKVLIEKVEKTHSGRDSCHACKAIGHDLDFILRREKKKESGDGARMTVLLEGLCKDLPLRHVKPSAIEELCEEMLEDFGDHIVGEKGRHWLDKNYYVLPKQMTDVIERVTEEASRNTTLAKRKLYDEINAGRIAIEKHLCTTLTSNCPPTAWDGEQPKPLTAEEKEAKARMDKARAEGKTKTSYAIPVDTNGVGGTADNSFTINPAAELRRAKGAEGAKKEAKKEKEAKKGKGTKKEKEAKKEKGAKKKKRFLIKEETMETKKEPKKAKEPKKEPKKVVVVEEEDDDEDDDEEGGDDDDDEEEAEEEKPKKGEAKTKKKTGGKKVFAAYAEFIPGGQKVEL
jgi:hypothetical protein